ncbi:MAG: two-component regulator propeller domain-containing protein [Bacteroidota bacterium]
MKNIFITTICILLFFSGFLAKSQTFTNYTTTDGLPDNFITGGVAIDTNNNKWFGTAAGVAKYNDASWTVFTTADGLIDNYTTCIAVDKNNNVWVGTNNGVSKYNGTSWTSYTTADGLADNAVFAITGDTDGSIWFGTYGYGVTKLNGPTWTTYTYLDGLPGDVSATAAINLITLDASGNKWFATDMGLVKYNGLSFSTINQASAGDSLLSEYFTTVAIDTSNNKWLGTLSYGMPRFDNDDNWVKNYRVAEGLYNNYVQDIDIDSQGNLWICMYASYNGDGGITKFDGTNGISYTITDGLADAHVIRLAVDKNDIIWIATGNGVSKFVDETGYNEPDQNSIVKLYPNPASDFIYVDNACNSSIAEISDITGKIISCRVLASQASISTEELADGLYFLKIYKDGKIFYGKFIKK